MLSPVLLIGIAYLAYVPFFGGNFTNDYFTVKVLDTWAQPNRDPTAPVPSYVTVVKFSDLIVNGSNRYLESLESTHQNLRAVAQFRLDDDNPYYRLELDYFNSNVTLEKYAQDSMNRSIESYPNLKILSVENTTIDGEKAIHYHWMDGVNVEEDNYYTFHNGKPYFLSYEAQPKYYMKYLAEFEQMYKSFGFVK